MSDVTPAFNMLLKKHEAPAAKASFNPDKIDEFLKEAYRIVSAHPLLSPHPQPTSPEPAH